MCVPHVVCACLRGHVRVVVGGACGVGMCGWDVAVWFLRLGWGSAWRGKHVVGQPAGFSHQSLQDGHWQTSRPREGGVGAIDFPVRLGRALVEVFGISRSGVEQCKLSRDLTGLGGSWDPGDVTFCHHGSLVRFGSVSRLVGGEWLAGCSGVQFAFAQVGISECSSLDRSAAPRQPGFVSGAYPNLLRQKTPLQCLCATVSHFVDATQCGVAQVWSCSAQGIASMG